MATPPTKVICPACGESAPPRKVGKDGRCVFCTVFERQPKRKGEGKS